MRVRVGALDRCLDGEAPCSAVYSGKDGETQSLNDALG